MSTPERRDRSRTQLRERAETRDRSRTQLRERAETLRAMPAGQWVPHPPGHTQSCAVYDGPRSAISAQTIFDINDWLRQKIKLSDGLPVRSVFWYNDTIATSAGDMADLFDRVAADLL